MFRRQDSCLAVVYGRRRLGKSRLLLETLPGRSIYFLADDREASMQRAALAREIGAVVPDFDTLTWPDWDILFRHYFERVPAGTALVLDEFPELVAHTPSLPGILQKHVDRRHAGGRHLVLCGSSQRMMQGLVLDRTAPLYGRAVEILKLEPLTAGWLPRVGLTRSPEAAIEAWSVWGGVPRYWELMADFSTLQEAIETLVLHPLGVLHDEADRLLLDDLRDTAQSASLLQLIGGGCHRVSELGARLGKPAGALARPLQRLMELGLVRRDHPFGESERDSKRSLYRIADPFIRFSNRFVMPNRSRLQARLMRQVTAEVANELPHYVASAWEELARQSVPHLGLFGVDWRPASAWWGTALNRKPMEIDLVTDSVDRKSVLLGSVKWESRSAIHKVLRDLADAADLLPFVGDRKVYVAAWVRRGSTTQGQVVLPAQVLDSLKL